jgi:predicted CXXCH cytochrome family protein
MTQKGLLQKIKTEISILLVLLVNMVGPTPLLTLSPVNANVTEPAIAITQPENGAIFKQSSITISGTIVNFGNDVEIKLYDGLEAISNDIEVIEGNWSVTIELSEGSHGINAVATDLENHTATSPTVALIVDLTAPNVTIASPLEGQLVGSSSITGTIEQGATLEICIDCTEGQDGQVSGSWTLVNDITNGNWTYLDETVVDGNHNAHVKATDQARNTSPTKKVSFMLDKTRPVILPEVSPKEDMTNVPINSRVIIKIQEINELYSEVITNSISLKKYESGVAVEGSTSFNAETNEITFTPTTPLLPNLKYQVVINSTTIVDSAGNFASPKNWIFTTELPYGHKSPHGIFENNVNTCGNCHGTHNSYAPKLLTEKTTDGSTVKNNPSIDNYCMSCHDGTVMPMPKNMQSTHKHNVKVSMDGEAGGSSCASCHNPHLGWSEENPNKLQDHIVYKHSNPSLPSSSKEKLCESCHMEDQATIFQNPAVEYKVFQYKKSTAIGILEDYELCLKCHNQKFRDKAAGTPVIDKYYDNLTEATKVQYEQVNGVGSFSSRVISNSEKNFSQHIMKAQDGSPLAGNMPCAECHDTHGSNNIKQLRTSLGQENPQSFDVKTDAEWTTSKKREFCLKCHNEITSIYGIKGPIPPEDDHDGGDRDKVCSECHSSSGSFIEAAHAPKQGIDD